MKLKKLMVPVLCVALLCGCAQSTVTGESTDGAKETTGDQQGTTETIVSTVIDPEDAFSKRDLRDTYDESECVRIVLSGDSASCDGEGVTVSGSTVTITAAGSYLLSGELRGMVIVDATKDDKIQLVLAGAQIESATSAAIYVKKADKVFITTAAGTENSVKNGGEFVAIDDNNIDGAIYAKDDLTLNGQGKLTITSPAGHGVVGKDDLVIGSGEYDITSSGHGLKAKDSLRIAAGTIRIEAGKDAIHSENDDDTTLGYVYLADGTFDLTAEGDGISASNSMRIDGGSYAIIAGGGSENGSKDHSENFGQFGRPGGWFGNSGTSSDTMDDSTSMKGIKSAGDLTITGGSFNINAADDGVHTNSSMTISGGSYEIATGDDGFHADDTLNFSNGTVNITTSYEGMEALHLNISGGDIRLVAQDDGLNAAGGTDSSFGGGDMGTMGDAPEMPTGEQGSMGDIPEMPTGGMGDAPQMPTGEMPDQGGFPGGQGGMGQMPEKPGNAQPGEGGNQDGVSELSSADTDGAVLSKLGGFPGGMGGFGGHGGMGGMGGMSSNSDGTITISGGELYIQASGDGIDANGTLEIIGGHITICGPNSGDTASLDFDLTGTISGGTVIATGASGMAQTFSSAQQGVINYRAGNQKAGTQVTLKDASGNVLLTVTPALDYSMIILTSPELRSGETYTLVIGSSSKQVTAS